MKKGKNVLVLLGALALVAPLVSCGGGAASSSSSKGSSSSSSSSSSTSSSSSSSSSLSSSSSSSNNESKVITQWPTFTEESIQIHYLRSDASYSSWALWIWSENADGKEYAFNGEETRNGAVASYSFSELGITSPDTKIGFIVKSAGSWAKKDIGSDRFATLSEFTADKDDVHHIYLKSAKEDIFDTYDYQIHDGIATCEWVNINRVAITTASNATGFTLFENGTSIATMTSKSPTTILIYNLPDSGKANFDSDYSAKVTFSSGKIIEMDVGKTALFKTADFADTYTYSGHDLGATYSKESTTFKVWSPLATSITLRVYNSGTPLSVSAEKGDDSCTETPLVKGEKGVYSATVTGDLAAKYYTYLVKSRAYPNGKEIVDPYAKSAGISGLRGQIVDFDAINASISGWDEVSPKQIDRKGLAIYETHVPDITSSSTWTNNETTREKEKTFAGGSLTGTTYTEDGTTVKTGFDHINELHPNAVELLPIFDQSNDETKKEFNWGYNPLNYNVLEGSYSSDPYDGYSRIKEFKNLVKTYNENGMNIIMDVVYNHVNGLTGSNFDVLCPGYYFRYSNGKASNGSGCGNETASEMPMFRLFMEDSTAFWAKEYKLGGFRFDLMGLHDLTTMNELVANLKTINPSIIVNGEPWTGGTSTLATKDAATQAYLSSYVGYGAFNDKMRDALIKGGLNAITDLGWADSSSGSDSDMSSIIGGIKGWTLGGGVLNKEPDKTLNYVTCHDNYTLVDRFEKAGITEEETRKKMAVLSNSIVLTSQGTSFVLAGEEMLRTKGGNGNSYNASYEVNALDYSLKAKNLDVFENYKSLFALKENLDGLHLNEEGCAALSVDYSDDLNMITYNLADTKNSKAYKVVHTNGVKPTKLGTADFAGYDLYLDTLNRADLTLSATTSLQPYETIIASKAKA